MWNVELGGILNLHSSIFLSSSTGSPVECGVKMVAQAKLGGPFVMYTVAIVKINTRVGQKCNQRNQGQMQDESINHKYARPTL